MKKFLKEIGAENGWMTGSQAEKYNAKYPYLSRDHAADILELIDESKDRTIWLNDSSSFAADSLFCEWAYVVDLLQLCVCRNISILFPFVKFQFL